MPRVLPVTEDPFAYVPIKKDYEQTRRHARNVLFCALFTRIFEYVICLTRRTYAVVICA